MSTTQQQSTVQGHVKSRPLAWLDWLIIGTCIILSILGFALYVFYGPVPRIIYYGAAVTGLDIFVFVWWLMQLVPLKTGSYSVRTTLGGGFLYPLTGINNDSFFNDPETVNHDNRYDDYELIPTVERPGFIGQQWGAPGYTDTDPIDRTFVDDRGFLSKNLGYDFAGFLTKGKMMLEHSHYVKLVADCSDEEKENIVFEFNGKALLERKVFTKQQSLYWSDTIIVEKAETGAGSYAETIPGSSGPAVQLLSTNLTFKIQARVINVFTLFSKNIDTHHAVFNAIDAVMRDYAGKVDIDQLIRSQHSDDKSEFVKTCLPAINAILIKLGLQVMPKNTFLVSIDPGDAEAAKMFKAQQQVFIAHKEGEVIVITAKAEGDAAQQKATGEAAAYTTLRNAQTTADANYNETVKATPNVRAKYKAIGKLGEGNIETLYLNLDSSDEDSGLPPPSVNVGPVTVKKDSEEDDKPSEEPQGGGDHGH